MDVMEMEDKDEVLLEAIKISNYYNKSIEEYKPELIMNYILKNKISYMEIDMMCMTLEMMLKEIEEEDKEFQFNMNFIENRKITPPTYRDTALGYGVLEHFDQVSKRNDIELENPKLFFMNVKSYITVAIKFELKYTYSTLLNIRRDSNIWDYVGMA